MQKMALNFLKLPLINYFFDFILIENVKNTKIATLSKSNA